MHNADKTEILRESLTLAFILVCIWCALALLGGS